MVRDGILRTQGGELRAAAGDIRLGEYPAWTERCMERCACCFGYLYPLLSFPGGLELCMHYIIADFIADMRIVGEGPDFDLQRSL